MSEFEFKSISKSYTVVIPTHDRPSELRRLLRYLDTYNCNVIILDSSSEPLDTSNFRFVKHIKNTDLTFKEKVLEGCRNVKTKFTILAADDDFPSISNIEAAIKKNNEFSLLIGRVAMFNKSFVRKKFWFQNKKEVTGLFTKENLSYFMSNYTQVLWGCYSNSDLLSCFESIMEMDLKNDNYIEIFIAICMASLSGILKVEDILCVREVSSSDHWGKRHKPLREAYQNNITDFLDDLITVSSKFKSSIFINAFTAYLEAQKKPSFLITELKKLTKPLFLPFMDKIGIHLNKNFIDQLECVDFPNINLAITEKNKDSN